MSVYLTIDDAPSPRARDLINYLKENRFGAILFCRGDCMQARSEVVIDAIRASFVVGNHSYNHKSFNRLNKVQARNQIERTDRIIERLYKQARVRRPAKYFRFPYGNRGATKRAQEANQQILHDLGYTSPLYAPYADWRWDIDVEDWHVERSNLLRKLTLAKKRLEALRADCVLDFHDKEPNLRLGLFQRLCESVRELGFDFYSNEFIARNLCGRY